MYHTDCLAVANCCDNVLDRSGALLGEVRDRHRSLAGEGKTAPTESCEDCKDHLELFYYDYCPHCGRSLKGITNENLR